MQPTLKQLLDGLTLSESEAEAVFTTVLTGQANEAQVGALLALLQVRGVTLDELVGGARVMRAYVTPVPHQGSVDADRLLDTCGTGGAPKTFNISTAVAIVVASCEVDGRRIRVAKHGGKSRTGRGSAEVLAQLGVNIDAPPVVQAHCLDEVGVCFSFAIHHHPAMRFAAGPRKSLGFPTIFNLLGPLTNPAGAKRQLLGVYDAERVEMMANALLRLGATRAMVVHGQDGMDEFTTTAPTTVAQVRENAVHVESIDPGDFGIARSTHADLAVDTLEDAAGIIERILDGERGAPRDIVLLNTAAALQVGDVVNDWAAGLECAADAIDSGRATATLNALRERSHEHV